MWNAMELKVKIFSNSAVSKKNICLKLTFSSHTYFPAPLRTGIEVKRVENDSSCLFWRLLGLLVVWLGLLWCYSRLWICSEVSILDIRDGSRFSNMRLVDLYPHWVFWTKPGVVCFAGPGLVVRGGPECGSVGLGRGTRALTAPENGTSDTCSLIAWTIDLLSNILWEGRLL